MEGEGRRQAPRQLRVTGDIIQEGLGCVEEGSAYAGQATREGGGVYSAARVFMVFEDSTEVCISACCPMTPPPCSPRPVAPLRAGAWDDREGLLIYCHVLERRSCRDIAQ